MKKARTNVNEEQALKIGFDMLGLFTDEEIRAIINLKEINNKSPFVTKSDEKYLDNDRRLVCESFGISV